MNRAQPLLHTLLLGSLACAACVAWLGCGDKAIEVERTSGNTSNGTTTPDAELPECALDPPEGLRGGPMVQAGRLDGACFWIDQTEVTWDAYNAFLADTPSPSPPDGCAAVEAIDPACLDQAPAPLAQTGDAPVTCVSRCAAEAYCAWAGKTLCGGASANPNPSSAAESDWYSACSHGGALAYGYADAYQPDACNVGETQDTGCVANAETCALRAVDTSSACASEAETIDMIGNVAEWVAACQGDRCRVRGGSYADGAANVTCATAQEFARDVTRFDIGFRCCHTP